MRFSVADDTPSASVPWERRVLLRVRGGDRGALGELFDQFSATVYGVAYGIVGDRDVAAAITETVFLGAWRHPDTVAAAIDNGGLRCALAALSRAEALQWRREYGLRSRHAPRIHTASRNGRRADHTEWARAEVMRSRTVVCLTSLPGGEREVVEAVAFGGDTVAEAATRVGIPVEEAATRLTSALRRMSAQLRSPATVSPGGAKA
ncbi:hypothetical protein H0B56_15910 [Haloechinothrix sp. YIM 98757]|uniref:DNA-directed RNA polymerase specialized sigma subunit, sigma24 family n=1 Tax=Haloechinothrix aidingensis TaxID=2752311 RepID=A0A838ACM9_9PSEU|nr:hypothetical protein [Haloechinothrix aidingensis]MBA0127036.1 hypothetical protein [Haloechinothrix aidingensis]